MNHVWHQNCHFLDDLVITEISVCNHQMSFNQLYKCVSDWEWMAYWLLIRMEKKRMDASEKQYRNHLVVTGNGFETKKKLASP